MPRGIGRHSRADGSRRRRGCDADIWTPAGHFGAAGYFPIPIASENSMKRMYSRTMWVLVLCLFAGMAKAQLPDFTGLVSEASPAVVSVMATRTAQAQARDQRGAEEEEMHEFFRRFFGRPGMPGMPQVPRDRTSQGTGFIISADGYVLT